MIYWRIKQPGKSWQTWSDGTAEDVDEAKVEAMSSVLDENNQLPDWALCGVTVEMFECQDIDDWQITQANAQTFRTNYLGLRS